VLYSSTPRINVVDGNEVSFLAFITLRRHTTTSAAFEGQGDFSVGGGKSGGGHGR